MQVAKVLLPAFLKGKSPHFLKKYFRKSWDAHQTLLNKKNGCIVHREFRRFPDFLRYMGPAPSADHTLDRIDFRDLEYGPGKVRWATPKEQANNRSSNTRVMWGGEDHTLSEWAEIKGIPYETLKKRHQRGDEGHRLFRPVGEPQGRAAAPAFPQDASPVTEARPAPSHLFVPGIPISPVPSVGADGWPIGLKGWEEHFIRAVNVSDSTRGRQFSRALFVAWVLGSRHEAGRVMMTERYRHIVYRSAFTPEEQREGDDRAIVDPRVVSYFEELPPLVCAIRTLQAEHDAVHARGIEAGYIRRGTPADDVMGMLRDLWKNKPCYTRADVVRRMKPTDRTD